MEEQGGYRTIFHVFGLSSGWRVASFTKVQNIREGAGCRKGNSRLTPQHVRHHRTAIKEMPRHGRDQERWGHGF